MSSASSSSRALLFCRLRESARFKTGLACSSAPGSCSTTAAPASALCASAVRSCPPAAADADATDAACLAAFASFEPFASPELCLPAGAFLLPLGPVAALLRSLLRLAVTCCFCNFSCCCDAFCWIFSFSCAAFCCFLNRSAAPFRASSSSVR